MEQRRISLECRAILVSTCERLKVFSILLRTVTSRHKASKRGLPLLKAIGNFVTSISFGMPYASEIFPLNSIVLPVSMTSRSSPKRSSAGMIASKLSSKSLCPSTSSVPIPVISSMKRFQYRYLKPSSASFTKTPNGSLSKIVLINPCNESCFCEIGRMSFPP